jgi:hypothetical protein
VNANAIANLKILGGLAALGVFACIVVYEIRGISHHHDRQNMVWFYDESEKELYQMPVTTISPDRGIGGSSGDGYRAVVVGFTGYKHDKSRRKIAYLEKYSPELKQALDVVIAARAAGHIFTGSVPSPQSEYFQSNKLVKRQNDAEWYAVNTSEGQKIMNEWRSWSGPDGGGADVCPVD